MKSIVAYISTQPSCVACYIAEFKPVTTVLHQMHHFTVWPVKNEYGCWSSVWLRGAVKIKVCVCTTYSVRQHMCTWKSISRLLLLLFMSKLFLTSQLTLNSVTFAQWYQLSAASKVSVRQTRLEMIFPCTRTWTEGAPTIAQARFAALWLFHCSVTVSLFFHLTCMSFALCISREHCIPLLPPSLSLLSLIFPDNWCYFLFSV